MSELRRHEMNLQGMNLLEHVADLIEDLIRQDGNDGYIHTVELFRDTLARYSWDEIVAAIALGEQQGRFSTGDDGSDGFMIQLNTI